MNYKLQITNFAKYFLMLFFIICNFSLVTSPVFAHVLKTDGTIGAVVHINPEDDPVVGKETTIYFDVKDTANRFRVENCKCKFIAKVNGQQVYEQVLMNTTATYNFPEKNIYSLELVGTPKLEGQFQPFRLSYEVRVERVEDDNKQNKSNKNNDLTINFIRNHIPHIFIISAVLAVCIFIIYRERMSKK